MFSAYGRAVAKNPDGSITVKVEILDDRTQRQVRIQSYTAASLVEIVKLVQSDLKSLIGREDDLTLNTAIVGKLLGSI